MATVRATLRRTAGGGGAWGDRDLFVLASCSPTPTPPFFFTFPFRNAPVSPLDFSIHGARGIVIPEICGDAVRRRVCHVHGHCRRCKFQSGERRRVGLCRSRSGMKSVTAAAAGDDSESQRASKKENSGVLGRRTRRVSAWPRRAPGTTSQRRTEFWRSMAARGDGNDEDLRSLGTGCVSNVDK